MKTWAEHLYEFYSSLKPKQNLPSNIQWLYPQQDEQVMIVVNRFLQQYFGDGGERKLLLGINPGRLGAGVTGVNFTAPKQLTEDCRIEHPFGKQTELSAEFIYTMIHACGGPTEFYKHVFIGSVCPLGFIKDGKNINYYDDRDLQKAVEPFIVESIQKQLSFPVDTSTCLCIGGEKNFKFLAGLNAKYRWFGNIIPLPHPRFIMQYRRKQIDSYIKMYLDAIKK